MRGLHILSTICIHLALVTTPTADAKQIDKPESPYTFYYDVNNGKPFDALETAIRGQQDQQNGGRLSYRSNGCSCQKLTCGCCTGINIQQFNFNREGCMNFTYDPMEFSLIMNMFMNNNPVYTNTVSAKNPPPLCLPFGVPNVPLPSMEFCARLFDVHTLGQNLQMCLDFETRVQHAPILVLHFNCMRMGNAGLALVKPGEPIPTVDPPTPEQAVTDIDIYDEVTDEIKSPHETSV